MRTILLVVDDKALLLRLNRVLRLAGYEVQEAASSTEALMMWGTGDAQVVIADILMADKERVELRKFRRAYPTGKIVAMVPEAQVKGGDAHHAAGLLGADSCIVKPFSLGEVLETVARTFETDKPAHNRFDPRIPKPAATLQIRNPLRFLSS